MKLHRYALFAGLLAFGVAACGDDVQVVDAPPQPPPPLQVSLSGPSQIQVGSTGDFSVSVQGGEAGASVSHTCAVSDGSIASVSQIDSGCRVTGLAAGNTSVTVTVQKGDQSATASASVQVGAVTPATVTISRVEQDGTQADINDISGQLDVTLNIERGDELLDEIILLIDGEQVASQTLGAAPPPSNGNDENGNDENGNDENGNDENGNDENGNDENGNDENGDNDDAAETIQQVTLSFNTDRYTIDDEAGTATPWHLNGERVLSADLHVHGAAAPRASNTITLIFNNEDQVWVRWREDLGTGTSAVNSATGATYVGGGDLTFEVLAAMYSGRTVGRVDVQSVTGFADLTLTPTSVTDGPPFRYTAEYGANAIEHDPATGVGSEATEVQIVQLRQENEALIDPASVNIVNLTGIKVDNVAPQAPANSQVVVRNGTSLEIPVNGSFFSSGAFTIGNAGTDTEAADAGVGLSATPGSFLAHLNNTEFPGTRMVSELDEAGADRWSAEVEYFEDKLGNRMTAAQISALLDSGETDGFNIDKTAPVKTNRLPVDGTIFRGTGENVARVLLFRLRDLVLAPGEPGAGLAAEADLDLRVRNLSTSPVLTFTDNLAHGSVAPAVVAQPPGGTDFQVNLNHPDIQGALGDGEYEVRVTARDQSILMNEEEYFFEFILDTTPPTTNIIDGPPSQIGPTTASQHTFTIEGHASDANGLVKAQLTVRAPTNPGVCALTDPLVAVGTGAGQVNRNQVDVLANAEDFTEQFSVQNAGATQELCFFLEAHDTAVDNELNPDPNMNDESVWTEILWN